MSRRESRGQVPGPGAAASSGWSPLGRLWAPLGSSGLLWVPLARAGLGGRRGGRSHAEVVRVISTFGYLAL